MKGAFYRPYSPTGNNNNSCPVLLTRLQDQDSWLPKSIMNWVTFQVIFLYVSLITIEWVQGLRREYYVVIKEIEWDYAPSGRNLMTQTALEEDE